MRQRAVFCCNFCSSNLFVSRERRRWSWASRGSEDRPGAAVGLRTGPVRAGRVGNLQERWVKVVPLSRAQSALQGAVLCRRSEASCLEISLREVSTMTTTGAPRWCKAGGGAAWSAAVPRRRRYLKGKISPQPDGENGRFPARKTQKKVRNR